MDEDISINTDIFGHGVRIWIDGDDKMEYLLNNPIAEYIFNSSNISFDINTHINYSCAIINDADDGIFNSDLCSTEIWTEDKLIKCVCIGNGIITLLETSPIDVSENDVMSEAVYIFGIVMMALFVTIPLILICISLFWLIIKQTPMANKYEYYFKHTFCSICLLVILNICCIMTFYAFFYNERVTKLNKLSITLYINIPILSQMLIYNNLSIFYFCVYKRPTQRTKRVQIMWAYVLFTDLMFFAISFIVAVAAGSNTITIAQYLEIMAFVVVIILIFVFFLLLLLIGVFINLQTLANLSNRQQKDFQFMNRSIIFYLLTAILIILQCIIIIFSHNYNHTHIEIETDSYFNGLSQYEISINTIICYGICQFLSFCGGLIIIIILTFIQKNIKRNDYQSNDDMDNDNDTIPNNVHLQNINNPDQQRFIEQDFDQ